MTNRIAVVYLVREPMAVATFTDAYRRHPSGIDHDLLVVVNGRRGARALAFSPELDRLSVPMRDVKYVTDFGQSLCAFNKVLRARHSDYDAFCYLNSWSRPVADDWLSKLVQPVIDPRGRVGLSGATGSWESFSGNDLAPWKRALKRRLFPSFPNPHIRTTGFAARTDVMLKIWPRWLYGHKSMEHLHESGRWSVSRRCEALGLHNVVVGADGTAYSARLWPDSRTFRSERGANLLVADCQTDSYNDCEPEFRRGLERKAWGKE